MSRYRRPFTDDEFGLDNTGAIPINVMNIGENPELTRAVVDLLAGEIQQFTNQCMSRVAAAPTMPFHFYGKRVAGARLRYVGNFETQRMDVWVSPELAERAERVVNGLGVLIMYVESATDSVDLDEFVLTFFKENPDGGPPLEAPVNPLVPHDTPTELYDWIGTGDEEKLKGLVPFATALTARYYPGAPELPDWAYFIVDLFRLQRLAEVAGAFEVRIGARVWSQIIPTGPEFLHFTRGTVTMTPRPIEEWVTEYCLNRYYELELGSGDFTELWSTECFPEVFEGQIFEDRQFVTDEEVAFDPDGTLASSSILRLSDAITQIKESIAFYNEKRVRVPYEESFSPGVPGTQPPLLNVRDASFTEYRPQPTSYEVTFSNPRFADTFMAGQGQFGVFAHGERETLQPRWDLYPGADNVRSVGAPFVYLPEGIEYIDALLDWVRPLVKRHIESSEDEPFFGQSVVRHTGVLALQEDRFSGLDFPEFQFITFGTVYAPTRIVELKNIP